MKGIELYLFTVKKYKAVLYYITIELNITRSTETSNIKRDNNRVLTASVTGKKLEAFAE